VMDADLQKIKLNAEVELAKLEATSPAKEVAGKAIGKYGLLAIVIIVVLGVFASLWLEEGKMAAVMGLLGASLTALIQMLNGIAGSATKQERPEFEVMKQLIDKLDRLDRKEPSMQVDVEDGKVTVKRGDDKVIAETK
jgi:ABC-type proline/glycine betaine transport system ATPase subunit